MHAMKLGGDRHTLHTCKMEGGGRTGACPWWGGGGGEASCPSLEKKKEAVKRNFNLFHLYLTNEIRGGDRHTRKMEWGGRTGACP